MKGKKSVMVMVGEYTTLAFLLPSTTIVGYVIGAFLDNKFGTSYLYLVFLLIGVAAGFVQLLRQLKKDTRD